MKSNWQSAEENWRDFFVNARGRNQPGSGNQPGAPGDTRYLDRVEFTFSEKVLLESKSADNGKESISIKEKWLNKILLESSQLGRVPLLGLTIGGQQWLAVPAWAIVQPEKE